MREPIKQLIDLIESEDWVLSENKLTPDSAIVHQFRPKGAEYPRLCVFGVQADQHTYLSFEEDEKVYAEKIMIAYKRWRGLKRKEGKLDKIEAFLGARTKEKTC